MRQMFKPNAPIPNSIRNTCLSRCVYIFTFCFITFILIFFNSNNCSGQAKEFQYADSSIIEEAEEFKTIIEKPAEEITDTTIPTYRLSIPADSVAAWKNSREYTYIYTIDSLLKQKINEREESFQPVKQSDSNSVVQGLLSSTLLKIIFWCLAIFAVIFLLYKLFYSRANLGKRQAGSAVTEVLPEDLLTGEMSDYNTLIRQSFLLEDYRMAVRYLFLRTLFVLNEKGHLQWTSEKTNFEYVQEMPIQNKGEFATLVLNYEYVWYGHLRISRQQFEQIENYFTAFSNKI